MSLIENRKRRSGKAMLATGLPAFLLAVGLLTSSATAVLAATEAEFKAALAAAEAAEKEAGTLRNRWTTTEAALAAAKKAGASGDFDQAIAQAKEAEAQAKASIFQATSEKARWKDMEIR
jgi:hypothetical protein